MNDSEEHSLIRTIDAYVKGRLSEEAAEELWVELLKNPEYIDYLETELAVRNIIREGRQSEEAGGHSTKSRWAWLSAAAAVAVLLVVYTFWGVPTNGPEEPSALQTIDIQAEMAVPELRRSSGEVLKDPDSLLAAGYHAVLSGDRPGGHRLFREVEELYGGQLPAARARLNIGILHYNEERYREAHEAFLQTATDSASTKFLSEKAWWLLGHTRLKMDRSGEARTAFEKAASYDGIYRKRVELLLRNLPGE